MLDELLAKRELPCILNVGEEHSSRNRKNLQTLIEHEYGQVLRSHKKVSATIDNENTLFAAGKATYRELNLTIDFGDDSFTFPFKEIVPNRPGQHPYFILINFRSPVPDMYLPAEELIDRGYGVFVFNYEDVTLDFANHKDEPRPAHEPLKDIIFKNIPQDKQCGTIAIWAWAASRILDYALTQPQVDKKCVSVVGHSRLGKTALLAGAMDERFTCAISNDSGCSGAAITRDKIGEDVKVITTNFDYWFNKKYKDYQNKEHEMPFDQHFLIGAIAPRLAYVGSARLDDWADPDSEYLSCVAASEMYKAYGKDGFIHPDRLPEVGDSFHDGNIGYHLRGGTHYFSREDWNNIINFINKHRKYY